MSIVKIIDECVVPSIVNSYGVDHLRNCMNSVLLDS